MVVPAPVPSSIGRNERKTKKLYVFVCGCWITKGRVRRIWNQNYINDTTTTTTIASNCNSCTTSKIGTYSVRVTSNARVRVPTIWSWVSGGCCTLNRVYKYRYPKHRETTCEILIWQKYRGIGQWPDLKDVLSFWRFQRNDLKKAFVNQLNLL